MTDETEERDYAGHHAYVAILKHYCGLTEEVASHLATEGDGFPASDCFCGFGGFHAGRGPFDRAVGDFDGYRNDWRVADFIAKAVRDAIEKKS